MLVHVRFKIKNLCQNENINVRKGDSEICKNMYMYVV